MVQLSGMQFLNLYNGDEIIKSLSERLKHFAREDNSYQAHIDQEIKTENLQFNLSWVLAHIILNLNFVQRTKEVFKNIIDEYNNEHSTELTYEDFEKLHWVRTVLGEIRIPSIVQSFIWKIGRDEKDGKVVEFPDEKKDLALCLQLYYQRCFEDSRLSISLEKLNEVIKQKGVRDLSIGFFEQRKIVQFNTLKNHYEWMGGEYERHLRDEISATLWLLVAGEEATDVEFALFFKLIQGARIWVGSLKHLLNRKKTNSIVDLAIRFLNDQPDLLQSEDEFHKVWLDSPSYHNVDIHSPIPRVVFDYSSTYGFIKNVKYHAFRMHDIFDLQGMRSHCYSLLRLIIKNDPLHPVPFQNIVKILNDVSRPYLVWTLYEEIRRHYPMVIPYLLTDTELVPVAFELTDQIKIDAAFLPGDPDRTKKNEAGYQLKQKLWLEMFDVTLENISAVNHYEEEYGIALARVLLEAANKIFVSNNQNPDHTAHHLSYRKKYDEALVKLGTKRITVSNVYPKPPISPRIVFTVLPTITEYLKKKAANPLLPHTQFIHLQSGLLDLCIEMLRLSNFRISETELTQQQIEKVKEASASLINLLQTLMTAFYSAEEIAVETYYPDEEKSRKARRGVNDFGFEIMDWGYLFLHFEKKGVLKQIDENFLASLQFDTAGNEYTEQNREQLEKIRLYLKSQMLALISINQKRGVYEMEGLPVKETLEKLEHSIKNLSLTNSANVLTEKRIDIFDDRFRMEYDMYYQPLTSLLYRSVNYFNGPAQKTFIEDFFAKSNNIGRMLTAINLLDSKELASIISKRIDSIDIAEFIAATSTTTELQSAMIEAINSDNHWSLAKPLIEKIQKHFDRIKQNDQNTTHLFFDVNLLLAYKEKDLTKLRNIPVPKNENYYPQNNQWAEKRQRYFIALFRIYDEKKYADGIQILKSLLSEDPKNIQYAFQLYRAETLNAIETK